MQNFLILALSLTLHASCRAGVTVYDGDFDGWSGDVGAFTTLDFIGLSPNEVLSNQYASLGATFTGFGGWDFGGPFSMTLYPQDGFGFIGGSVVEIAFSEPMHAFAAHGGGFFRFQLFSGAQIFHQTDLFGGSSPNQFGGVTSTQGFDRIRLLEIPGDVVDFDNLYFSNAIPSPAAGAFFVTLLGFSCRRRNRT
jgi:hypothetical protein